jgi:integrase
LQDQISGIDTEVELQGITESSWGYLKTSASQLLRAVFEIDVTQSSRLKLLMKGFSRDHPKKAKYMTMWDPGVLLDYYRGLEIPTFEKLAQVRSEDTRESKIVWEEYYRWIRRKVIFLTGFYGMLRPCEIASLSLEQFNLNERGLIVNMHVKSDQLELTPVFFPRIEDHRICPVAAVELLRSLNAIILNPPPVFLLVSLITFSQFSVSQVRHEINNGFTEMGIPIAVYGPYTIKHAAASYLVSHGVRREEIEQAMHYKNARKNDMLTRHYAVTATLQRLGLLLAKAVDVGRRVKESSEKKILKIPQEDDEECTIAIQQNILISGPSEKMLHLGDWINDKVQKLDGDRVGKQLGLEDEKIKITPPRMAGSFLPEVLTIEEMNSTLPPVGAKVVDQQKVEEPLDNSLKKRMPKKKKKDLNIPTNEEWEEFYNPKDLDGDDDEYIPPSRLLHPPKVPATEGAKPKRFRKRKGLTPASAREGVLAGASLSSPKSQTNLALMSGEESDSNSFK